MATIIKGLLSQNLPWGLVLVGVFLAVTLELCGIHSLSFAVGAYLPVATTAPEPGFVEQDAEAMVASILACIGELKERLSLRPAQILSLGVANQTETLVVCDPETGRPEMPAIVWQCRRGAEEQQGAGGTVQGAGRVDQRAQGRADPHAQQRAPGRRAHCWLARRRAKRA